jgi:hypothetical protein
VSSVKEAAAHLCPMRVLLERVVVSQAGVVMACWQPVHGPDPVALRQAMQVHNQPLSFTTATHASERVTSTLLSISVTILWPLLAPSKRRSLACEAMQNAGRHVQFVLSQN